MFIKRKINNVIIRRNEPLTTYSVKVLNTMNFIEEMSNEELTKEFERFINRMHSYSASNEESYKEKLMVEILKRMNKKRY